MTNRLKEMGDSAAWHLLVSASLEGARQLGFSLKRQPGRGLSNTYEMTKGGKTQIVSVRTTRDRWVAFPPLESGAKWKTLDDVDVVLVSAVDSRDNPQNVDVYLFDAGEVRKRFNAGYAARVKQGHTVRDNYGMWLMLDKGEDGTASQVGHSLAVDYPAIAHFTIDELQQTADPNVRKMANEAPVLEEEVEVRDASVEKPKLDTVAEVLAFARDAIAQLTGMSIEAIKLELKMGV